MIRLFDRRAPIALIAGALAGAVIASAVFQTHSLYVSSAVVSVPASHSMRDLQAAMLSRDSLRDVIATERLYPRQATQLPMEDVMEAMRRNVEIRCLDAADRWTIRFAYEDAAQAQRATRAMLDKMFVPGLAVISPPA